MKNNHIGLITPDDAADNQDIPKEKKQWLRTEMIIQQSENAELALFPDHSPRTQPIA